jgi:endonuclease/exonuclease/phosphatase family metal-dependent hydrolase
MLNRLFLICLVGLLTRPALALSLLHYNVNGNGANDWTTNATQVQAIGRQLVYLQPDIVAFNEIPNQYTYEVTNFVKAFLPGYYLATNSATDGFIRSVIASPYPITRSASYLKGSSLAAFGATGYSFTRDLFQATISVPGFAQPLDVFTTHLKATSSATSSNSGTYTDGLRRAAEAGAISNWFVAYYLPTNAGRIYTLSGDLNEDINRPGSNYVTGHPIQKLISSPTGLRLTTPVNPITSSDLTESIRLPLDVRFDYILPCPLLSSNITSSQVFRTDLLANPPSPLQSDDDSTASDHLPVLMVFKNPYDTPFRVSSIGFANQTFTLNWESIPGRQYRVEASSNLTAWTPFTALLPATGATTAITSNLNGDLKYFRVYRAP